MLAHDLAKLSGHAFGMHACVHEYEHASVHVHACVSERVRTRAHVPVFLPAHAKMTPPLSAPNPVVSLRQA